MNRQSYHFCVNYAFKKFKSFLNPSLCQAWVHLVLKAQTAFDYQSESLQACFTQQNGTLHVICAVSLPPVSAHTSSFLCWNLFQQDTHVAHWHSDSNMLPCSPSTQSVDILVTILLINRSLFCSVRF